MFFLYKLPGIFYVIGAQQVVEQKTEENPYYLFSPYRCSEYDDILIALVLA